MRHWDEIRRRARAQRAEVLREAKGDSSAESLLAAAERLTGMHISGYTPNGATSLSVALILRPLRNLYQLA